MSSPSAPPTVSARAVESIRSDFPALDREQNRHSVAYFDGPGGTQVPQSVSRASEDYLLHHNANTHWNYPTSAETDRLLEEARTTFADFFNGSADEVVFGANMTTLTFHLSRALGSGWGEGDEIVITQLDHQANQAPWRVLERERGVRVHTVPMRVESGTLDGVALDSVLGPKTKLVAVGGASNALGTINDVGAIAAKARAVGALTFVDGVHSAPHVLPDVRELDCDVFASSAYKFYGPHVGVLYVRRELAERLEVPRLPCGGEEAPEKLETGTLNHEGIVGAAAAVDYLASLVDAGDGRSRRRRLEAVYTALHERGRALLHRLRQGLDELPGVRLYGPPPEHPRTPTVAFTVDGVVSSEIARRLACDWGVFLSHGDFYASGVTEALGLEEEGLVRAGCACYTTEEEVERLLRGVGALVP